MLIFEGKVHAHVTVGRATTTSPSKQHFEVSGIIINILLLTKLCMKQLKIQTDMTLL